MSLDKKLGLIKTPSAPVDVFNICGVGETGHNSTILDVDPALTVVHFKYQADRNTISETATSNKSLPDLLKAIRGMANRLPIKVDGQQDYRHPIGPDIRQTPHISEHKIELREDMRELGVNFAQVVALHEVKIKNPTRKGDMLLIDKTTIGFNNGVLIDVSMCALEVSNLLRDSGHKNRLKMTYSTNGWREDNSFGLLSNHSFEMNA